MTVRDIIEMFSDENMQEFTVYDLDNDKVLYTGYLDEVPCDVENLEVSTIDCLTKGTDILTLNVFTD